MAVAGRRALRALLDAPPPRAIAMVAGCFLALAALDFVTPTFMSFRTFYLVVITYAAWSIGRPAGLLAAAAAMAIEIWCDGFGNRIVHTHGQAHFIAIGWTLSMRFLAYAAVIELARGFRRNFDQARRLGDTDALTGLLNRRAFREAATASLADIHARGRVGILVYADLDGFKQVNDRFGHSAGDAVLQIFAATLKAGLNRTDPVCRSGGDEFAACLDAPSEEIARQIVFRLQRTLTEELDALDHPGLSCSLGAAYTRPGDPPTAIDALIGRADGLMYQAKKARSSPLIAYSAV